MRVLVHMREGSASSRSCFPSVADVVAWIFCPVSFRVFLHQFFFRRSWPLQAWAERAPGTGTCRGGLLASLRNRIPARPTMALSGFLFGCRKLAPKCAGEKVTPTTGVDPLARTLRGQIPAPLSGPPARRKVVPCGRLLWPAPRRRGCNPRGLHGQRERFAAHRERKGLATTRRRTGAGCVRRPGCISVAGCCGPLVAAAFTASLSHRPQV